jgi:hypothetical protein
LCCALVFLLNQYLESLMLTSIFPVCGQDCKRPVVYQNESTANHIPNMSQKLSRVNIQTENTREFETAVKEFSSVADLEALIYKIKVIVRNMGNH